MKLTELTLTEAAKGLKEKKFSAVDLTEAALGQIEAVEPKISAFVTVTAEESHQAAEEADKKIARGENTPLTGLPIAVKDCFCTAGVKTTNSSNILKNFVPPYDATSWKRLKEEGMVMVGKTNTDEFTMGSSTETSAFGPTKNPWDTERVPGGSSGGSAASVVAGEALVALGTDTGGSIRQPASLCGCTGLKPTYGRIPRTGVLSMASSLDTVSFNTKNCEDAALLLQYMSGPDGLDATCPKKDVPNYLDYLDGNVKGLRLGVPKEYFIEGMDPEVEKTVREAIDIYKKMGAEIVDVSLPHTKYAAAVYYIIAPAEISANLARYDGVRFGHKTEEDVKDMQEFYSKTRAEGFGDEVKRRIMIGTYVLSAGYYDAYYKKAQKVRTLIKKDFDDALNEVDALLTPVSPTTAFKIGEKTDDPLQMYLADVFTLAVNMAGVCGMSIPAGFSNNLPVGMQIIGPQFQEEKILKIGDAFQRETDFHKKFPEL